MPLSGFATVARCKMLSTGCVRVPFASFSSSAAGLAHEDRLRETLRDAHDAQPELQGCPNETLQVLPEPCLTACEDEEPPLTDRALPA